MSPESVLDRARAAGLTLRRDGDALHVRPADRLTPELRAALMAHKSALLALLQAEVRDDLAERITLRDGLVVSLRALRLALELEARGHVLSVGDGRLHVGSYQGLTALDRDRIERHHHELLMLANHDADVM